MNSGDDEPVNSNDIDFNGMKEAEEDKDLKTEVKNEDGKFDAQNNESQDPKIKTEADNCEAKVVADVAENEKKEKMSHKTKDRIWGSFR